MKKQKNSYDKRNKGIQINKIENLYTTHGIGTGTKYNIKIKIKKEKKLHVYNFELKDFLNLRKNSKLYVTFTFYKKNISLSFNLVIYFNSRLLWALVLFR